MRNSAKFAFRLLTVLVAVACLGSCKDEDDCDPQKQPLLTGKEKAFIPDQPGDTLHFKDEAGKPFFLVCKSKTLTPVTYIPVGHENTPCQAIYQTWDKLAANFEGNLLTDNGNPLFLEARIEGGDNPNDPEIVRPCNAPYKCSSFLIFVAPQQTTLEQFYLGKTEESLFPVIGYFNNIQQITLGGQQFQKLNTASISDNCSSVKPYASGSFIKSPLGLDSIYYSGQMGLIRVTTVGGKKYQRVL